MKNSHNLTAIWCLLMVITDGHCQEYEHYNAQPFSFASYYESNMVLQRAPKRASVWGYAPTDDLGKIVHLNVFNSDLSLNYETAVHPGFDGQKAVWSVMLDPISDTRPFSINATLSNYPAIVLSNVLFGDVWVCSGQSNMKLEMQQIFNASEEVADAVHYGNIRVFSVAQVQSNVPLQDFSSIEIHWSMPTAESIRPFSAVCWLFAKNIYKVRGVPMGLIESSWGGTCIETWSSPESLHACGLPSDGFAPFNLGNDLSLPFAEVSPPQPYSGLWNGMIHPLLNLTIYGAIWYQGESNADYNRDLYNCTFPAMIDDWRQKWFVATQGQTDLMFPFGFVQIGPTTAGGATVVAGYSDIRWHQTADDGYAPNDVLRKTFMAVSFDLTDVDVHYRDKETVSRRLAIAGLAIAYGQKGLKYQGPFITHYVLDPAQHSMTLIYDEGKTEIVVRNEIGFEICCNEAACKVDGLDWHQAPVEMEFTTIGATSSVVINTTACVDVKGLRYGWRETPFPYLRAAVYSSENELPAPPFVATSSDIRRSSPKWFVRGQRAQKVLWNKL